MNEGYEKLKSNKFEYRIVAPNMLVNAWSVEKLYIDGWKFLDSFKNKELAKKFIQRERGVIDQAVFDDFSKAQSEAEYY